MSPQRIFGLVLLGVGVVLLLLGVVTPQPVVESVKEGSGGTSFEAAMWYLVGGASMALVGIALSLVRGNRRVNNN